MIPHPTANAGITDFLLLASSTSGWARTPLLDFY
jgi:hypothetical protein